MSPRRPRRQPRLPLPDDRPVRVEKYAYLDPELAAAADARAKKLGVSFSSYLCDLVRADVAANSPNHNQRKDQQS